MFIAHPQSDQNDSVPKSKVGTFLYIAPEVIADRNYDGKVRSCSSSSRGVMSSPS